MSLAEEAYGTCGCVILFFGRNPPGFISLQKVDPGAVNNVVRYLHWMGTPSPRHEFSPNAVIHIDFPDSSLSDVTFTSILCLV